MDVHEDIVIEILSHLPVQSLLRFKSVCKFWCNTIDSIALRKSHIQNQLKNREYHREDALILQIRIWSLKVLMSKDIGKLYEQKLFDDRYGWLAVTAAANGLICLHKYNRDSNSSSIVVCNPCLGKIKILPVSPVIRSALPELCIGFGYDYIREEYKVVQLTYNSEERKTYVEVYSPTANTWRQVITNVFDDESLAFKTMVVNYSTHHKVSGLWAHWRIERLRNEKIEDVLLSFDMHNEVFKTTLLDIPKDEYPEIMTVFARDDDSFVVFVLKYDELLGVWEGSEGRWTHVGDVDLKSIALDPWPETLWERDVILINSENEYSRHIFKLCFYDYSKKEIKRCEMPRMRFSTWILQYRCSLISP